MRTTAIHCFLVTASDLENNPSRDVSLLQLIVDLRQISKLPHRDPGLHSAAPDIIYSLQTLLQGSNQVPCDMKTLDDDAADRRFDKSPRWWDAHTTEGTADLEHVGCLRECLDAPRRDNDSVCSTAAREIDDFSNEIRGGPEVDLRAGAERFEEFHLPWATVDTNDLRSLGSGILD